MAANVIDSLVVELGLDPAKFTEGQRQALGSLRQFHEETESQGKRVESQTKRLNDTLLNFRREVVSTLGLFIGGAGAKEFISYITNMDAATGRLGRTMNISTSELSAWQGVIKQVGGTVEEANSALAGLSGEINRFNITGQSSILGVVTQLRIPGGMYSNGRPKTADTLLREISGAVQGMDPAQATAILSMIPGMNTGMLNALLEGPQSLDRRLQESRRAGTATDQSAQESAKFQEQTSLLRQSMDNLGRVIFSGLLPPLIKIADFLTRGISSLSDTPEQRKEREERDAAEHGGKTSEDRLRDRFGEPPQWLKDALDKGILGPIWGSGSPQAAPRGAPRLPGASPTASGSLGSASQVEAYIRQSAIVRGIDPEIAVKVWGSEGRSGYVGDQGSSFGPFQLHYGGLAPGGNSGTGLGDAFTARTGLHARDPSTWQQQVDFSLDEARRGGWGPWHGWKGLPFAGIGAAPGAAAGAGAPGGGNSSVTVSIGKIEVNAPQAKDGEGVAKEIGPALRRQVEAGAANYGGI